MSIILENLYKLLKNVPFSSSMQIPKEKNFERVEENETNMEVFSVKTKTRM